MQTSTATTITLRDGRRLGFAEYGDLKGKPIFFFGGSSSRFLRPPDATTTEMGVRLITAERPGFGLSDFQPNRTLLDWADDVVQLADALGLDRFGVIGGSQGGPFATVCAYKIPDRLTAASLISAVAPLQAPGVTKGMNKGIGFMVGLSNVSPGLLTAMYSLLGGMARRNPEKFFEQTFKNLPPNDQQIFRDHPEIKALFAQDLPEAFRQGGRGGAYDMRIVAQPWNFRLEDIRAKVFIWQGESDPNVTPAMGRYLASKIPNCNATFVPNEGHFLLYHHWREILAQQVSA